MDGKNPGTKAILSSPKFWICLCCVVFQYCRWSQGLMQDKQEEMSYMLSPSGTVVKSGLLQPPGVTNVPDFSLSFFLHLSSHNSVFLSIIFFRLTAKQSVEGQLELLDILGSSLGPRGQTFLWPCLSYSFTSNY